MKYLNVPDASFGKTASVQTARGKRPRRFRVVSVEIERLFRFGRQVHQLRHRCLHAVRHFVLANAGNDFRISEPLVLLVVQRRESVQLNSPVAARYSGRIAEVQNGIALAPHQHALVIGR